MLATVALVQVMTGNMTTQAAPQGDYSVQKIAPAGGEIKEDASYYD